jgi:hypothetical protein
LARARRTALAVARSLSGGEKGELSIPTACCCHAQQPVSRPGYRDEPSMSPAVFRSVGEIFHDSRVIGLAPTRSRRPRRLSVSETVMSAHPSGFPDSIVCHPRAFRANGRPTPAIRSGTSLGCAAEQRPTVSSTHLRHGFVGPHVSEDGLGRSSGDDAANRRPATTPPGPNAFYLPSTPRTGSWQKDWKPRGRRP